MTLFSRLVFLTERDKISRVEYLGASWPGGKVSSHQESFFQNLAFQPTGN